MTAPADGTARITSGTARLDHILGGGLPRNAITLVVGAPGSGKTILAQQCVYANAAPDRPAVYLSTVSEPLEKILRFGQSLSFFDPSAVGSRVRYEDLGVLLGESGLPGMLARVREIIRQYLPGMLVIDGFKALRAYATDTGDFRRFLHDLTGVISALPITTLWVGEYETAEHISAPEFAVADAIVSLGTARIAQRSARSLQVLKLRGGSFQSGEHAYRISSDGIAAFPRLADPGDGVSYQLQTVRRSSGVPALDDMLSEGFWAGASTLVAGPTGVGKTLTGLHFTFAGVRNGENVVIASLQEDPSQLEQVASGFDWSLRDDRVTLLYRSPVDLYIDEWVYEVLDTIDAVGATRVHIDSLSDLENAAPDPARFREYVYSLLHRCSSRGVSVIMTYEMAELTGATRLTERGASHLADNVVVMQYRGLNDQAVRRTLTVLKTRGTAHDPGVREFTITPDGITLAPHHP